MRGKKDLEIAKAGYREAVERGDREEQARWANQVGHACKERGQYVEALKWFRLDYDISSKRKSVDVTHQGNLMPTCQSLGEIYFRLNDYEEALIFQKKHFQLAEETDNLVEQQRASTQLGRTYLEMYEQKDEFSALENAKEFFKLSMEIARTLKENPPSRDSPSFVKELVDAYNNMGLLMTVIEDHRQAVSYFEQGLQLCDEEELRENDDARSRLHHNLGRIYTEKRDWEKAKYHTQTDISICQKIPHPQGEAKGFINLGEMHFKRQRYEDATRCFERALHIAQSLEDEDDLVLTAQKNLNVVKEAEEKLLKLAVGEQQLKRLQRKRLMETNVRSNHRNEEYKLLIELISLAEYLQAWEKHLKFAKSLKSIVKELGDMEKLGDAMETVGESYYSLKKFLKAKKWILKSFDLCKRIGHLEGQCVAMINYGNTLDSLEDWEQALKAYKDAYKSQGRTKMLSQQISALENLQYCYLVRMKSISDAKTIQSKLQALKELKDKEDAAGEEEYCSETDSESKNPSAAQHQIDKHNQKTQNSIFNECAVVADSSEEDDVGVSPVSVTPEKVIRSSGHSASHVSVRTPLRVFNCEETKYSGKVQVLKRKSTPEKEERNLNLSNQENRSVKRPRVMVLDEEELQDFVSAADIGSETHASLDANKKQEISELESGKSGSLICGLNEEVRKCSGLGELQSLLEGQTDNFTAGNQSLNGIPPANKVEKIPESVTVHMGDQMIMINLQQRRKDSTGMETIDWLKREIVESYSSRNPTGLKPMLWHLMLKGRILHPSETLSRALVEYDDSDTLEANVDCWVPVPLLERYQLFCKLYQQEINANLAASLRESRSLEDKICASDCNLDDNCACPLLMALSGDGTFSHLDLSHNLLGSQSMNKIQKLIAASNQPNLGLILDLHGNCLGPVSIAQICECPVTLSRLEVLNLSGNRLTDAAARFIANLIKNSQALEVLQLHDCGLTTRSIQKIVAAVQSNSPLVKLALGENRPISNSSLAGLIDKLSQLSNFLELDISGIIVDKVGAESLGKLLKSSQLNIVESSVQKDDSHVVGACVRTILKLETSHGSPNWTVHLPRSCELCTDTSKKCILCIDNDQDFR
ncbi:hypothetical protein KP509_09G039700 [Ceratopteris richardii]|uniref:Uncharacterized protein n=1 Tax=Ceratopteris richardii TaxID=49495 RepID=A0A8T2U416_CERRI|nr:hypothetical protein KP509_09G039700 [Ceratopteris richardii]